MITYLNNTPINSYWGGICSNPNLTYKFWKKHIEGNWEIDVLSRNHNLPLEIIEERLKLDWNWNEISKNHRLIMDFIQKHKTLLDWKEISKNPSITMKDIEEHLDEPWVWEEISSNPNLTPKFINKYTKRKWDWKKVSMNLFGYLDKSELFETHLLRQQQVKALEECGMLINIAEMVTDFFQISKK